MSQSKKTGGSKSKPMADVAHPGTTAPSDTSKPIINQRPIMKDPMVVEDDKPEEDKKPLAKKTHETKIAPPKESAADKAQSDDDETTAANQIDTDATANDEKTDERPSKKDSNTETAADSAQDAKLQQVIESKKYFLPLNAVEHRRSKRVAMLGFVLALLLAIAWVDIALDAGLIHLDNIKPVTHFFSS